MQSLEYVREARLALSQTEAGPKERLRRAARAFWQSVLWEDEWPHGLGSHAEEIYLRILMTGNLETSIDRLEEKGVQEASERIRAFCELFEKRCANARPTRTPTLPRRRPSSRSRFPRGVGSRHA